MRIKMTGLKKVLTGALALTMCLGATFTTMAGAGGTVGNPAKAHLSKTLRYAEGLNTPTANFTFDFEKTSKDGRTDAETLAKIPEIAAQTLTFGVTDVGTPANGIVNITKSTTDLMASMNWTAADGAGTYVWKVTERATGFSPATGERMIFSEASFNLVVKVAYDANTDSYYVESTQTDQTNQNNGNAGGGKGGADNGTGGPGTGDADYNFTFTNIYSIQGGGNPGGGAGDNEALAIGKTVAGGGDAGRNFAFTLTLDDSAVTHTPATYVGTIYDGSTATATTVSVSAAAQATFNLKHGQRLVFHDMPVGAVINVTETGTPGYKASISGMETVTAGAIGASATTGNTRIATGANVVTFTNTFDTDGVTVPGGVLANNLPFFAMIGAGILVVALFVVINKRKVMR